MTAVVVYQPVTCGQATVITGGIRLSDWYYKYIREIKDVYKRQILVPESRLQGHAASAQALQQRFCHYPQCAVELNIGDVYKRQGKSHISPFSLSSLGIGCPGIVISLKN